jgi:tetratricopeptide (TPR) repeat protein
MKLNPQDADAKYNYEFVKKELEKLKQQQQQSNQSKNIEPSEGAKRAKAEADAAVKRRDYSEALAIMEKQLAEDPTTSHYADFIERLKGVTGVQDTAKH